jgi:hypothetical protein
MSISSSTAPAFVRIAPSRNPFEVRDAEHVSAPGGHDKDLPYLCCHGGRQDVEAVGVRLEPPHRVYPSNKLQRVVCGARRTSSARSVYENGGLAVQCPVQHPFELLRWVLRGGETITSPFAGTAIASSCTNWGPRAAKDSSSRPRPVPPSSRLSWPPSGGQQPLRGPRSSRP